MDLLRTAGSQRGSKRKTEGLFGTLRNPNPQLLQRCQSRCGLKTMTMKKNSAGCLVSVVPSPSQAEPAQSRAEVLYARTQQTMAENNNGAAGGDARNSGMMG